MNPPPLPPGGSPPPLQPFLQSASGDVRNWAQKAAKFSFFAPIIALCIGVTGNAVFSNKDISPELNRSGMLVIGVINVALIAGGFGAGIAALFGMMRHGRKGVLGYAIFGTLVGAILVVGMALLPLTLSRLRALREPMTEVELQALPQVKPGWQTFTDSELGFRLEVPPDLPAVDRSDFPLLATRALFRRQVNDQQADVVMVSRFGAMINDAPPTAEQLTTIGQRIEAELQPVGAMDVEVALRSLTWNGQPVPVIYARYKQNGSNREICTVGLPLAGEAVGLNVNLIVKQPGDCLRFTQELLDTFKGRRGPRPRP